MASIILGIDSSDDFLAVGLAGTDGIIFSKSSESRQQGKNLLHRFLGEVLAEAGIGVNKLDCVAVAIGPGSFTGLRVGLAVAKGICWSLAVPLVGISALAGIAAAAKIEKGKIVAVKDAKRDEFYYAAFFKDGSGLQQVILDSVGPPREIVDLMSDGYSAVGPGIGELSRRVPDSARDFYAEYSRERLGGAIAVLGHKLFSAGKTLEISTAVPNYVRIPKPREWKP